MGQAERQARYDAAHTVQIKLKLNTTTDADVLAALEAAGNKQGYIKRLIREDLAKNGHDNGHDAV